MLQIGATIASSRQHKRSMKTTNLTLDSEIEADPFGERASGLISRRLQLLGSRFLFESNHQPLLELVDSAFAGLPHHRLGPKVAELRVKILLGDRQPELNRGEPAPLKLISAGRRLLGGTTYPSNVVVLCPRERTALVIVSPSIMRFPYHVRYELIEFAVFTLAARARRLVSLHAGCVGIDGRGVLLMGPSGAGKSTVALHCLLDGFEFLSEDSVFVSPRSMQATGIASFLHTRADSLRWLGRSAESAAIRRSPIIRRRSGERKYELDLRRPPFLLAKRPLKISCIVFLSSRSARSKELLMPISRAALQLKLDGMQAYGASQPHWRTFSRSISSVRAFELRRGTHPRDAVGALRALLTLR